MGMPPFGGDSSKPAKRSSTYDSQSPPLVYSPSLTTSTPTERCFASTAATECSRLSPPPPVSAYARGGRLPTWVVKTLSVLRLMVQPPAAIVLQRGCP